MNKKHVAISAGLAAKYDKPEQFERFDDLARKMLAEKPEPTNVAKPRGRPKKRKDDV